MYSHQFKDYICRYANVSSSSINTLLKEGKIKTYEKGSYLIFRGDIAKKIYFVCRGLVTSEWVDEAGHIHIKNFFTPGNLAASTVSALQQVASEFSLCALQNSTVLAFDFATYKSIITNHEDLKSFYIGYLEQKWVIENEKRQISFAAQNATYRYLTFLRDFPELNGTISQKHIASYLGITPTQLSRIRKSLYIHFGAP